jgi:hypothetical protein
MRDSGQEKSCGTGLFENHANTGAPALSKGLKRMPRPGLTGEGLWRINDARMDKKAPKTHFIVSYRDPLDSKLVELCANKVGDSELGLSFVSVSDFIFENHSLVVDPGAEDLKRKFENVKTLHLSLYSILSIQEVGHKNRGLQFKQAKSNLVVLPGATTQKP